MTKTMHTEKQSAHADRQEVVAFDFDGTLTDKDSLLVFISYVFGRTQLVATLMRYAPWLVLMRLHLCDNHRVKERVFAHLFRGMAEERFNRWCRDFARDNRAMLRQGGIEAVGEAQAQGKEVVIVSASIDNWVSPFFPGVGVLGTQVEVKDGRLTGRFLTRNCYGQEKVNRLLARFPQRDSYRLTAYGDSRGDRELLAFADEAHYKPFRTEKTTA